ncbi:conserved protein of unknown function [Thiomonas sp. X19]|uniref:hypothetical protein n=1 Tax=Thiomonas sp. X19 TaxID=1050370 RepID=UPI0007C3AE63|nr:hypothetical protein [Thiomonas sp. X19]OYV39702.1 MAG: hypothetical protein B7Z83_02175 [Thiomonas sp. 20-64-5]CQR42207.1 conserved hypothetical protein [Thiomonas sp. CB3]SCC95967.1 conserved protein of unknown function [Thiomonas sp. X19]
MALKSKPLHEVRPTIPLATVTQEEVVRINLNVPKRVRQAWKARALREDKTLTDLIMEAMKPYSREDVSA